MTEGETKTLADLEALSADAPWQAVAQTVVDVRRTGIWRQWFASEGQMIAAVASITGQHPNTIRRYAAAYLFLKELTAQNPKFQGKAEGIPALGAETLKRIHALDPEAAVECADKLLAGSYSARRLQERYQELKRREYPAGSSLRRRAAPPAAGSGDAPEEPAGLAATSAPVRMPGRPIQSAFVHEASKAVRQNLPMLSPTAKEVEAEVSFYESGYRLPFVRGHALAIGRQGITTLFADGYRFVEQRRAPSNLNLLVPEVALAASYLRRLWLVLEDEQDFGRLDRACDELHLENVGVCIFHPVEGGILDLVRAPTGQPVPDRQEIALREIARRGIPDL